MTNHTTTAAIHSMTGDQLQSAAEQAFVVGGWRAAHRLANQAMDAWAPATLVNREELLDAPRRSARSPEWLMRVTDNQFFWFVDFMERLEAVDPLFGDVD